MKAFADDQHKQEPYINFGVWNDRNQGKDLKKNCGLQEFPLPLPPPPHVFISP